MGGSTRRFGSDHQAIDLMLEFFEEHLVSTWLFVRLGNLVRGGRVFNLDAFSHMSEE